jgi:hypothetical protein
MERKHVVPENQGKLFIVAEDAGFWQAQPDELPYRPENFNQLDVPVPPEYVLCNSNYGVSGGTSSTATAGTVDKCAALCEPGTCVVRTYDRSRMLVSIFPVLCAWHAAESGSIRRDRGHIIVIARQSPAAPLVDACTIHHLKLTNNKTFNPTRTGLHLRLHLPSQQLPDLYRDGRPQQQHLDGDKHLRLV